MNLNEIKDPKLRKRLRVADFLQNRRHAPSAVTQPHSEAISVAPDERESIDPIRCFTFLKICCFRCRSLDDDNPFEKYFVDALRYAGAIFDDTKKWCKIEVTEQLVENRAQERTEIEVAYGPKISDTSGD